MFVRSAAILPSVTYAKPASADPSATLDTMLATFASELTVFELRIELSRIRLSSRRV